MIWITISYFISSNMVEEKGIHWSSPERTPKLQLAEQPSTGECWIPPQKDTPHPRAKEKPQQDGRRGEIIFIFILSALWCRMIRSLWKVPHGRDWLREKLGLVLMGGARLSKSWIPLSVDGWGCVPSLLFDLRPVYGGGKEDNGKALQKVLCKQYCTQCSHHVAGHCQPMALPESPAHSRSLGQSLVGSLFLSPGSWHA